MGAGQSLPTELTHEKLFELTKNTRNVMNILLEYMLKELTVRDFLALSNPAECKKYVLFKANTLYKYFYELKIEPVTDKKTKDGIIAFRPIKELITPSSPEEEKEKQTLCLILAYYYTRIFQIYGALALTLIDDIEVATRSGLMGTLLDDKQRLLAPGQKVYRAFGGTIPSATLGLFNFLRSFLYDDFDRSRGYKARYFGEGDSQGEVYFKRPFVSEVSDQNKLASKFYDTDKPQRGFFYIGYRGASSYAVLEVIAKKEGIGSSNIIFEFVKLQYRKRGTMTYLTSNIPTEILSNKFLTIIAEKSLDKKEPIHYYLKDSTETIPDFFNTFFTDLIPFIKALSEGNESVIRKYDLNTKKNVSEAMVFEELKLAKTIQNLTRVKPYGHCIARALQLLRTAPFKDEPGLSSICKAKFIESIHTSPDGKKVIVSRSGIPVPGSSLDTSPGMAALAQLFYDTIQNATVKIGEKKGPDGKSTLDQYINFMSKMAKLFGDDENRTADTYLKSGLKGIINKRDKELCTLPNGVIAQDILIPPNTTKTVYNYVKQLFEIQYIHAGKCGGIFKQLFNIKTDKVSNRFEISLSDNVLQKGFSEIERINALARNLLIDYYSNCETTYLKGMAVVVNVARKASKTQANTT